MDTLADSIRDALDWDNAFTKDGDTQNSERYYIEIIKDMLTQNGYEITGLASSQQSIDIRTNKGNFECKKVNGKKTYFMFNDSLPKPGVYYIFIRVIPKTVTIIKGEKVIIFYNCTETSNKTVALKLCKSIMDYLENKDTIQNISKNFFEFIRVSVICGKIDLIDYRETFRGTVVFGNARSYPRPNWSISV
tara:strand:- start:960 stop:1532 length:573 start_codon:yes stop_codon:yes gene_type:complete